MRLAMKTMNDKTAEIFAPTNICRNEKELKERQRTLEAFLFMEEAKSLNCIFRCIKNNSIRGARLHLGEYDAIYHAHNYVENQIEDFDGGKYCGTYIDDFLGRLQEFRNKIAEERMD